MKGRHWWPRTVAGPIGIASLAFSLGLGFLLGPGRLAGTAPALMPRAWGLDGCASVLPTVAALLLAMAVGPGATLLCALALYARAAWVWRAGDAQYRSSGSTSRDQRTLRASGAA